MAVGRAFPVPRPTRPKEFANCVFFFCRGAALWIFLDFLVRIPRIPDDRSRIIR